MGNTQSTNAANTNSEVMQKCVDSINTAKSISDANLSKDQQFATLKQQWVTDYNNAVNNINSQYQGYGVQLPTSYFTDCITFDLSHPNPDQTGDSICSSRDSRLVADRNQHQDCRVGLIPGVQYKCIKSDSAIQNEQTQLNNALNTPDMVTKKDRVNNPEKYRPANLQLQQIPQIICQDCSNNSQLLNNTANLINYDQVNQCLVCLNNGQCSGTTNIRKDYTLYYYIAIGVLVFLLIIILWFWRPGVNVVNPS